jgi:hypothetical protein
MVNQPGLFVEDSCAEIAIARPIIGEKVIVVATALSDALSQSCERVYEEIDSAGVCMDENLLSLCIGGKTQNVLDRYIRFFFVAHWYPGRIAGSRINIEYFFAPAVISLSSCKGVTQSHMGAAIGIVMCSYRPVLLVHLPVLSNPSREHHAIH